MWKSKLTEKRTSEMSPPAAVTEAAAPTDWAEQTRQWQEKLEKVRQIQAELLQRVRLVIERYEHLRRQLPAHLAELDEQIREISRQRSQLITRGEDPDAMIRRIGEKRRQAEADFSTAAAKAGKVLDDVNKRFNREAGVLMGQLWSNWTEEKHTLGRLFEPMNRILDLVGLWDELRLTAETFSDAADGFNMRLPSRPQMAKAKAPKMVSRDGFPAEFREIISNLKAWLK